MLLQLLVKVWGLHVLWRGRERGFREDGQGESYRGSHHEPRPALRLAPHLSTRSPLLTLNHGLPVPSASASHRPTPCPAGTFSSLPEQTVSSACQACPRGFYCKEAGLQAPSGQCPAGERQQSPRGTGQERELQDDSSLGWPHGTAPRPWGRRPCVD